MITNSEFEQALREFEKTEARGSFYDMAVDLISHGYEMEAYFLILSTWNFAGFRYGIMDFPINKFRKTIQDLDPIFKKFEKEEFLSIDFTNYREDIVHIYKTLSEFKGIKYTGAAKVMHIRNRNVFLIWDSYIKGNKTYKEYNNLPIVKKGNWIVRKYGNDGTDYFQFLVDMQNHFKHISANIGNRTFAKAIDEYNYMNITTLLKEKEKS